MLRDKSVKYTLLSLLERSRLQRPAFRLWEALRAFRTRDSRALPPDSDSLQLPSSRLMVRVAGTADPNWFIEGGRLSYTAITQVVPVETLSSVLDFGCGAGRTARYWKTFDGSFAGSDIDRAAVNWCRRNLAFGRFEVNGLEPPLAFEDESYDLVYAFSVFTHLTAHLQSSWRDELWRVLRPNGMLLISVHGPSYLPELSEKEQAELLRGELVVRWGHVAGTNLCSVYHSESSLRQIFDTKFELVRIDPEAARGNPKQDLVLLRKVG